jgi:very-short-patch-repair endonuclease
MCRPPHDRRVAPHSSGVTAAQTEIDHLLRTHSVLSRRDHPHLKRPLEWLAKTNRIAAVLPGVYASHAVASQPWARVRALGLWDPAADVTGRAAAYWSFWDTLAVDEVTAAVGCAKVPQPGYALSQRRIPAGHVLFRGGVSYTAPALTAIDLVPQLGGSAIDEALRTRSATLDTLREALAATPHRRGNRERALTLLDSRDNPWSEAERLLHRILRKGRLTGWATNVAVETVDGTFFADVTFRRSRLILEADGWEWHGRDRGAFHETLRRHTALEAAGWRVLHFGYPSLATEPDWVLEKVRQSLALCESGSH